LNHPAHPLNRLPARGSAVPSRRVARFRAIGLAMIFAACGAAGVSAQTLANVAANYQTSGTITDTFGTGTWLYYASTNVNPSSGTLTALTFQSVGNAGNSGYGYSSGGFQVPAVSSSRLFSDGAVPTSNVQLAWHPGPGSPVYTVLRWTAGAGESGSVVIAGNLSRVGEPGGDVDFHIYANGVSVFSSGNLTSGTTSFSQTVSIGSGQFVDFVLGYGSSNSYGGDESLISATITAVPEPASTALLSGAVIFGLTVVRYVRRRRQT